MSGDLKHKIALVAGAQTPDLGGGADVQALTVGPFFWAALERLSSTQDFGAPRGRTGRRRLKRLAATVRAETVRYFSIEPGQRLIIEGAGFEVTSLESADIEGRRIILICEEVAGLEEINGQEAAS